MIANGEGLPYIRPDAIPYAIEAIDEVVHLYMNGMRKVHRRILSVRESELIQPQENIAEHTWSVERAAETLYENQKELGITFSKGFDINVVVRGLGVHDVGEVKADDVDAMCQDEVILSQKAEREIQGFEEIRKENKYLGWMADLGIRTEEKDTPEAKFGSDIDKHVGTRIILHYARYRWWGFAGEITTREDHNRIMRKKLLTPLGHSLYDGIENDFDRREEEYRQQGRMKLFPTDVAVAKAMLTSELHKDLIGYRKWPGR